MRVTSFEPTPNPNALKFNVDERLIDGGSRSFDTPIAADGDDLATALFALGEIASVFYMPNFVTVNKTPTATWSTLAPAIGRVIESVSPPKGRGPSQAAEGGNTLLDQIVKVLDTQVRPALAGDGGGLEVIGLEGKTLLIQYQGACGSCPSSISGTLQAIQSLLQAEVDEELVVTAA